MSRSVELRRLQILVVLLAVLDPSLASPLSELRRLRKSPGGCEVDGKLYPPMADIPTNDPCEKCVCSEWNFKPVCVSPMCARPHCEHPVHWPDMCCPVCPNGPDCMIDGNIVPYDTPYIKDATGDCVKVCVCTGDRDHTCFKTCQGNMNEIWQK